MIHARIRTPAGILTDPPAEHLHGVLEAKDTLAWVDLESPTQDELGLIAGILGWDHLTVEDVSKQGQRAKLEEFPGYHYLVMHALAYAPPPEGGPPRLTTPEIDFVIGARYVVTIHNVHVPHITESREVVARVENLLSNGPDHILYVLTDRLVDSYFPVLDEMQDAVDDLEDRIVENVRGELLPRIFDMKHDAMILRKVTSPLLDVFSRLTAPGTGIVPEERAYYFRDVHDHIIRVFESTDSYRELMAGALDAYLSTVSNRMNDVMKRLTVVAALFLPITFLTGLLGMNLRESPPWDDPLFWVFLAGMFGLSIAQYIYMKRQGWT